MNDYSQTGEQAAILKALGIMIEDTKAGGNLIDIRTLETKPGRFLDIGAWSATTFSNTRALFELGWSGIFLEPSPGPLKGLVEAYGRDEHAVVIGAAVTVTEGLVALEVTDDAVTAPAGSAEAGVWKERGGYYGTMLAPAISLQRLFDRFGGDFQMVSIDTEGTSVDLFVEMLRIGPRPRVVVVEHNDRIVEIANHAQNAGYTQVLLNGNNVVYRWG